MAGNVSVQETKIEVGDATVALVRGGSGSPLLVLHDELGYPGWMSWNDSLAADRELIIPLQPGYGVTPGLPWIRTYRDLAVFYARMVREQGWAGCDVLGFSAGAYIAAEMAVGCPDLFSKMTLVGPLGCRPTEGDIFDFLAVTIRSHVAATVTKVDAPEFAQIYGGEMTPSQFELFEDARAETARIGWEPFMFNDALPHHLQGIGSGLPTLLIRGGEDLIAPHGCLEAYSRAMPQATALTIPGVGHRPEIEDPPAFISAVSTFLGI